MDLGGPGCIAWTNPNNIKLDDGSAATCYLAKTEETCQLAVYNFGFTTDDVPENATVTGVELAVQLSADTDSIIIDDEVYLRLEAGEIGPPGDNQATIIYWAAGWYWFLYGLMADLWGNPTLDGAIVRTADFGFYLRAQNINPSSPATCFIDVAQLRILYTIPEVAVTKGIPLSKRIGYPSRGL